MFDKFGPLTYEELNKTAEGLKMEGDIESLILLAEKMAWRRKMQKITQTK